MLDFVHNIRRAQARRDRGQALQLWSWSPVTAWRHVKTVMQMAGIRGTQASPKGLRHGFGVAAVQAHIPLNLVQRWLGHAQLSTTAIYAEAVGQEEQEIAARMWV
jgi:site-specific recombinase XerD